METNELLATSLKGATESLSQKINFIFVIFLSLIAYTEI